MEITQTYNSLEELKNDYPEVLIHKNCKDITNKTFGKITVLYKCKQPVWIKGTYAYWGCKCECGKFKPIRGAGLNNGTTTSCGCQTYENASKKNVRDLTGQRFGKLTVIEDTKKRSHAKVIWKCKCDCGNYCERVSDSLIQNDTKSCGRCNQSIGIITIEELLKNNNIDYEVEKSFPDLLGKNNMPYRYDFYLPKYNRLIEFDGIQHFEERTIFKDSLEQIQYRDNIKNKYAKENNITLLRIPYYKIKEITLENLLNDYFIIN